MVVKEHGCVRQLQKDGLQRYRLLIRSWQAQLSQSRLHQRFDLDRLGTLLRVELVVERRHQGQQLQLCQVEIIVSVTEVHPQCPVVYARREHGVDDLVPVNETHVDRVLGRRHLAHISADLVEAEGECEQRDAHPNKIGLERAVLVQSAKCVYCRCL